MTGSCPTAARLAAERIKDAEHAVKSLISGAKQSKVYSYLEKARKRFHPEDLGLREPKKKKE